MERKDKRRFVKIGKFPVGKKNNICDVLGVSVGHYSMHDDNHHTGVTVVLPHNGNLFKEKVIAGCYAYNGFGKSTGLVQMKELGTIETPLVLTNTLCVGKVWDAVASYMLRENPEIGVTTGTVNPIVFECNDSSLNNIRERIITEDNVMQTIACCMADVMQGSVGAGSGMTCLGFKGGIGSSSRIIQIGSAEYTLGVLVNSNFQGSTSRNLIFCGRNIGGTHQGEADKGSIIVIIATDAPLDSRQLERLCKRSVIGIGRTGSYIANGSGDIITAFSTKNRYPHLTDDSIHKMDILRDECLNDLFEGVMDATEEAILNSLLYSPTVQYQNHISRSIFEEVELFKDLLISDDI